MELLIRFYISQFGKEKSVEWHATIRVFSISVHEPNRIGDECSGKGLWEKSQPKSKIRFGIPQNYLRNFTKNKR